MEQIAKELIELKQQKEEIEKLYNEKRDEMYNALTLSGTSSFQYDGYRFQKFPETTMFSINKARLYSAMTSVGLPLDVQQQIMLAAGNEFVQSPFVKITKM